MANGSTEAGAGRGFAKAVALVTGAGTAVAGWWSLTAPRSFADAVGFPGSTANGEGLHYIRSFANSVKTRRLNRGPRALLAPSSRPPPGSATGPARNSRPGCGGWSTAVRKTGTRRSSCAPNTRCCTG